MTKPVIKFRILRRVGEVGAFGMMFHRDDKARLVPFCCTLERSYEENSESFEAKIHDGLHYCSRTKYHKGGYETYEVHIVGHDRILLHKGNWPEDSEGCILLGETFTDFDSAVGIQNAVIGQSAKAFDEFMKLAGSVESFFLEVVTS